MFYAKDMALNMCDTCDSCFADCQADVEFGTGVGGDNVIRCNLYDGQITPSLIGRESQDANNLDNMFESDSVIPQIDKLAQHVANEMAATKADKDALTKRNASLDAAKEQLHTMLKEAGMASCKLECGLNPRATVKMQYYAVNGISGPEMFAWLTGEKISVREVVNILYHNNVSVSEIAEVCDFEELQDIEQLSERWPRLGVCWSHAGPDLGDIIKPTVNFNTLQSTLKAFEEQGGEVPAAVVTKSPKLSVTMGGKSKFLAAKGVE